MVSQLDTLPLSTTDKRRVQALAVQGGGGAGAAGAGQQQQQQQQQEAGKQKKKPASSGDDEEDEEEAAAAKSGASIIRVDVIVDEADFIPAPPSIYQSTGSGSAGSVATGDSGKASSTAAADVEHAHPIITFLNDVETDQQYAQWPSDLRTLMQPSWQLHQLRRNLYNSLLVVDLAQVGSLRTLQNALQFVQMRIPIRFGIVLIPTSSSSTSSASAVSSSPTSALEAVTDYSLPATGLQFALLHAMAVHKHGQEAGRAVLRSWSNQWAVEMNEAASIAQQKAAAESGGSVDASQQQQQPQIPDVQLSVESLVTAYASALQQVTGSWSVSGFRSEAKEALADAGGHLRSSLAGVSSWIRRTGLPAPCTVMNGRPSPGLNLQQDMMQHLQADMQLFQSLLYAGKIDDSVAPSVYHAILGRATRLSIAHARELKRKQQQAGNSIITPPSSKEKDGSKTGGALATTAAPSSASSKTYGVPGAGLIVPRWHPSIFAEEADQAFLPLSAPEAAPLLRFASFVHAPGTVDDVKPVTLTLMDDLSTPHGLYAASALLAYVRTGLDASAASTGQVLCVASEGEPADCPVAPPSMRRKVGRAMRVGLVHVPSLLLSSSSSPSSAAEAGGVGRYRGPSHYRANTTIGDLIAISASLITGRQPSLLQVRADDQGPLIAGIVDIARGTLKARNSSDDLISVGCTGCHTAAVSSFLTRLAQWLGSGAASVPIKQKTAEKLLTLLHEAAGVAAHGQKLLQSTHAGSSSPTSPTAVALKELWSSLTAASDIARRLAPASVPETRSVSVDEAGSTMSIRALAANGRLLALAGPSAGEEEGGDASCVSGTGAAPPSSDTKTVLSSCLAPGDVSVLTTHEKMHRGSAVAGLLKTVDFPGADPGGCQVAYL